MLAPRLLFFLPINGNAPNLFLVVAKKLPPPNSTFASADRSRFAKPSTQLNIIQSQNLERRRRRCLSKLLLRPSPPSSVDFLRQTLTPGKSDIFRLEDVSPLSRGCEIKLLSPKGVKSVDRRARSPFCPSYISLSQKH